MSVIKRILLFFVLPVLGILFYQPSILANASSMIGIVVLFFLGLGYLLWRGYSKALTFMIFVNGMNVIVRIMMLLSTSFSEEGVFNLPFTVFGSLGAIISLYLVLRLDEVDVRQIMTR